MRHQVQAVLSLIQASTNWGVTCPGRRSPLPSLVSVLSSGGWLQSSLLQGGALSQPQILQVSPFSCSVSLWGLGTWGFSSMPFLAVCLPFDCLRFFATETNVVLVQQYLGHCIVLGVLALSPSSKTHLRREYISFSPRFPNTSEGSIVISHSGGNQVIC